MEFASSYYSTVDWISKYLGCSLFSKNAATMGSENSSDPHERIKQLEKLVEDQEEQIDELRGRVENQQSNLAHRMQVIEKLQRERDELRKQNADLVAKVAQLSRRQSVTAGSSSPSTNRSRTSPPQLPR